MGDSSLSKIDWASEHIEKLNELLREKRPFTYVLETDTITGQRATFAKKNEAVVTQAANIAADVVHNLRTALDHAYWEIVFPFVTSAREQKAIQFPFSETDARLDEGIKNRLADRVSPTFFQALVDLKPHAEAGGNELLYLIHALDSIDKHRFPIPTADYARVSSGIVRTQVPDLPTMIDFDNWVGQNDRDIVWQVSPAYIDRNMIGKLRPPTTNMFEKELNVPIDIVILVGRERTSRPLVPTLHELANVTRSTVDVIRRAV